MVHIISSVGSRKVLSKKVCCIRIPVKSNCILLKRFIQLFYEMLFLTTQGQSGHITTLLAHLEQCLKTVLSSSINMRLWAHNSAVSKTWFGCPSWWENRDSQAFWWRVLEGPRYDCSHPTKSHSKTIKCYVMLPLSRMDNEHEHMQKDIRLQIILQGTVPWWAILNVLKPKFKVGLYYKV